MTGDFAAQVDAWTAKARRRAEAVFRESAQRVVEEMKRPVGAGGKLPVDTGYLRASIQASTATMPLIRRGAHPEPGHSYMDNASEITMVIANMKLGEIIYIGVTAEYGAHVEYGARGRPPAGFVRGAAQGWQGLVNEVTAAARARG
jgi:hypothetical protein